MECLGNILEYLIFSKIIPNACVNRLTNDTFWYLYQAITVLNGECKSLQTMPVEFGFESLNGDVDIRVVAHVVKGATGNMKVI